MSSPSTTNDKDILRMTMFLLCNYKEVVTEEQYILYLIFMNKISRAMLDNLIEEGKTNEYHIEDIRLEDYDIE